MSRSEKLGLFVTGPRSRKKDVARFEKALGNRAKSIQLNTPTHEEFSTWLRNGVDCVVLFGGDGTLNRYLGDLLQAQIPVLMVPTGSGNDFARAHGIRNVRHALQAFDSWLERTNEPTHSDIGSLIVHDDSGSPLQRYFSCCANIGVDAEAVYHANRLPNLLKARGGYLIGALRALLSFRPRSYAISANQNSREKLWFIAMLNTPTYGGGLRIAPHASTQDRRLEVAMCRDTAAWRLLANLPRLLTGSVQGISFLQFAASGERLTITADDAPQLVCADGEVMGYTLAEVSLAKESLRVLRRNSV